MLRLARNGCGGRAAVRPRSATCLARYADCLLAQLLQIAACNALHPIEQRCLRWMLSLQDRVGDDTLPITHESLASMLASSGLT